MTVVNIHELKARLSEYVDRAQQGDRILICKRNQPVAELLAIEQKRTEARPIGGGPYRYDVPDAFFEPMPDDFLNAVESGPLFPDRAARPSRVAEPKAPTYGADEDRRQR
jgi:prevent-host-death family protein